MNFRKPRREEQEINLTPLIDVVFLLLIFFMVTTTFKNHAALKVDLPEASAQGSAETQQPLELVIDREGGFHLGEQALIKADRESLLRVLLQRKREEEIPLLIIRADAQTPHQAVVTAMDVARELEIERVRIATTQITQH